MQQVAIIGAGELGGSIAQVLASNDLAAVIRLIDPNGTVAAGKALDIMQSAPIAGFAARVVGSPNVYEAAGSQAIVIADRTAAGAAADNRLAADEWSSDEGLAMLRDLSRIAVDAVIVCAGPNQRALIERAVREGVVSPARIIGSAPEALAGAIRSSVALEADVSPASVSLTVLGVPPSRVIVPWDQSTVAGVSLVRALAEPARRRVEARIKPMWPPGAYSLARSAGSAIACVSGRSRQVMSCFVALSDRPVAVAPVVALPVTLDVTGLRHSEVPHLNTHDRVGLENAVASLSTRPPGEA
jgi:malate dehydrogenase